MVRAALILSASSASALEPTGLLQATVGMQSHLSAGSDKVSSLKKMEKEWQAAAKKGSRVADDILYTVYDSMQGILADAETIFGDIGASVTDAAGAVTAVNTQMAADHEALMNGTDTDQWRSVCGSLTTHAECRGDENDACSDRDDECDDEDTTLTHCAADNPLCNCANLDNTAEQMITCLEDAKDWYDNYHAAEIDIESAAEAMNQTTTRGYFLGGVGQDETRCNVTLEAEQCANGTIVCNNKTLDCDGEQRSAQLEFCGFNTMCSTWCTGYGTEYASAISTFNAEMEVQLTNDDSAMNRNMDVCFAAKKVTCYINVIANKGYQASDMSTDRGTTYDLDVDAGYSSTFKQADGNIAGSGYDYDFCLAYTPNCDHLSTTPPTPPGQEDCTTYGCSTTVAASGLPEASSWLDAYYKQSPAAVDCSHNVDFYLATQPESLGATC